MVFGAWESGTHAPAQRPALRAVTGPLGGGRVWKGCLHLCCRSGLPELESPGPGPCGGRRSLLCWLLLQRGLARPREPLLRPESPGPEGPVGLRLRRGQAARRRAGQVSRRKAARAPFHCHPGAGSASSSLCLSPTPFPGPEEACPGPLSGAWRALCSTPSPQPPAFAGRSRLTFDPFLNSRALLLLPPFTNSHHFLHDISTMAADFASGLDLLLLLPPGTTPSCCSPLSLPQAPEPDVARRSAHSEPGCLSFHPTELSLSCCLPASLQALTRSCRPHL